MDEKQELEILAQELSERLDLEVMVRDREAWMEKSIQKREAWLEKALHRCEKVDTGDNKTIEDLIDRYGKLD